MRIKTFEEFERVNEGKSYEGLTDAEITAAIEQFTDWSGGSLPHECIWKATEKGDDKEAQVSFYVDDKADVEGAHVDLIEAMHREELTGAFSRRVAAIAKKF